MVVRLALGGVLGLDNPFITFFPAVILASLFGGGRGGAICLLGSLAYVWVFLLEPANQFVRTPRQFVLMTITMVFGFTIVLVMSALRSILRENARLRAHERLLGEELRHRIKNNLTIVHTIAIQTLKSSSGDKDFERRFTDRIKALGRSHDRLAGADAATAPIAEIVAGALEPFEEAGSGRIQVSGEDTMLASGPALALGLCLHELATNAAKYGALSADSGKVSITWRAEGDEMVQFVWVESGGPVVSPPARTGFGLKLLETSMAAYCRQPASLDHKPEGVTWSATFRTDVR